MAKLLHIDASPRSDRSHSRVLTKEFIDAWLKSHPIDTVAYRDVGHFPPPHVDEAWIAAAFTIPDERTQQMREALEISDNLVDELLTSDTLILGLPMYNFGVPSTFKAYIDQIVRVGRTFDFHPDDLDQPYKPLVHGKRVFVIVATGSSGYEGGDALAHLNHLEPYLRTVLGHIGVTDLTFVYAGDDEFGGERLVSSLRNAHTKIDALASTYS